MLPPRGKGRPKGSRNKVSTTVKANIESVFEKLGGIRAMVEWARDEKNRTEFYRIYSRLLPHEVVGKDDGPVSVTVTHKYEA